MARWEYLQRGIRWDPGSGNYVWEPDDDGIPVRLELVDLNARLGDAGWQLEAVTPLPLEGHPHLLHLWFQRQIED